MRLAAIYIESHDYIFDKPQTINFGGKYQYTFKNESNTVFIDRKLNEQFIQDFFNYNNGSRLTNINAIVGQNGAGKTTILDIIRKKYIDKGSALPDNKSLFLVEKDDYEYPFIIYSDFPKKNIFINEIDVNNKNINCKKLTEIPLIEKLQTIYYSPHFEFKFNPNFDKIDSHDISFEKFLEKDLEPLPYLEGNENGWGYAPRQQLLFKNTIRQIEFLSSDLILKNNIFENIFQFREHHKIQLIFRGYNVIKEWNTPWAFRAPLASVAGKIDEEIKNTDKIRKYDSKLRVTNQLEVNKYFLKRIILKQIISLLYAQMERSNDYLSDSHFNIKLFNKRVKEIESNEDLSATHSVEIFLTFLKFCKVGFFVDKGGVKIKIFNQNLFRILINLLKNSIDSATSLDEIDEYKLFPSKDDAINILKAQNNLLNDLNRYYYKLRKDDKNIIISESNRLEEFVNFMPFNCSLSTGENALLNLFSNLYCLIQKSLNEKSRYLKINDHYILLIDEGDLGFHPTWKKKYINSLCKTLAYFFELIENKPSFQIIFTTHDPFTLSDLPNANVVYVERKDYNSKSNILNIEERESLSKTFGANIHSLLTDSFFLEGGLMGEFAKSKIEDLVRYLKGAEKDELNEEWDEEKAKGVIGIVGDEIVKMRLDDLFEQKFNKKAHSLEQRKKDLLKELKEIENHLRKNDKN
ncbi:MAG: hypothetical protein PHT69_08575 [Bacteroidales bacterium]|nr:hypothetical protein [Bacteroidales bacterium]